MPTPASHNRRLGSSAGTVITASGQSGVLSMESNATATLNLYATISAISGAGATATFGIQFCNDAGGATWPASSFAAATTGAAQTATGTDVLVASAVHPRSGIGDSRYYRITWTVAGTSPSITLGALYTDN